MSSYQETSTHSTSGGTKLPIGWARFANHLFRWLVASAVVLATGTAGAQEFGNWVVERSRDLLVATVTNSADSVFGYSCDRSQGECLFFFVPEGIKCSEGGRYALLMNGGRESTSRNTTCRRLSWADGQQYANVLEGTDGLRKQLLNADNSSIGIARGTGTDNFSISKFSVRGFRGAYDRVNRFREDTDRRDYGNDNRGDNRGGGRGENRGENRPVQPVPSGIADVELYEHDDFQGRRLNVRGDVADLGDNNFNDIVSSLIVNRGRWELCSDASFRGNCKTYGPGRYPNVRGNNDEYSSIRRAN